MRTHHLHLVPFGSALLHERLRFRDRLRSDARVAAEYAALKLAPAARFEFDREAYTDAKEPIRPPHPRRERIATSSQS